MEEQAEEIVSEMKESRLRKKPVSFTLYEEYSQTSMSETFTKRKNRYEKATCEERNRLEKQVEIEIATFRKWLETTKSLKGNESYYCALSLKSLLLGLPIGIQIAQLFNMVLGIRSLNLTCDTHKEFR